MLQVCSDLNLKLIIVEAKIAVHMGKRHHAVTSRASHLSSLTSAKFTVNVNGLASRRAAIAPIARTDKI